MSIKDSLKRAMKEPVSRPLFLTGSLIDNLHIYHKASGMEASIQVAFNVQL